MRFPGVIGADTEPGGGDNWWVWFQLVIYNQPLSISLIIDYAVHIFHEVAKTGRYTCFLKKDTRLPMIYIDDCLEATVQLMEAPAENLSLRTYNVQSHQFHSRNVG